MSCISYCDRLTSWQSQAAEPKSTIVWILREASAGVQDGATAFDQIADAVSLARIVGMDCLPHGCLSQQALGSAGAAPISFSVEGQRPGVAIGDGVNPGIRSLPGDVDRSSGSASWPSAVEWWS